MYHLEITGTPFVHPLNGQRFKYLGYETLQYQFIHMLVFLFVVTSSTRQSTRVSDVLIKSGWSESRVS